VSCTNVAQIATLGANVTNSANRNLTRNTIYRYRVRVTNSAGYSAYSSIVNVTTRP